MDITTSNFVYSATIKLCELPHCKAQADFPGITDVAFNSRCFNNYVECVDSATALVNDLVKSANSQNVRQLTVSVEANPIHTGKESASTDWREDELTRFWIFDKRLEGNTFIHAVGQAQIFMVEGQAQVLN